MALLPAASLCLRTMSCEGRTASSHDILNVNLHCNYNQVCDASVSSQWQDVVHSSRRSIPIFTIGRRLLPNSKPELELVHRYCLWPCSRSRPSTTTPRIMQKWFSGSDVERQASVWITSQNLCKNFSEFDMIIKTIYKHLLVAQFREMHSPSGRILMRMQARSQCPQFLVTAHFRCRVLFQKKKTFINSRHRMCSMFSGIIRLYGRESLGQTRPRGHLISQATRRAEAHCMSPSSKWKLVK